MQSTPVFPYGVTPEKVRNTTGHTVTQDNINTALMLGLSYVNRDATEVTTWDPAHVRLLTNGAIWQTPMLLSDGSVEQRDAGVRSESASGSSVTYSSDEIAAHMKFSPMALRLWQRLRFALNRSVRPAAIAADDADWRGGDYGGQLRTLGGITGGRNSAEWVSADEMFGGGGWPQI